MRIFSHIAMLAILILLSGSECSKKPSKKEIELVFKKYLEENVHITDTVFKYHFSNDSLTIYCPTNPQFKSWLLSFQGLGYYCYSVVNNMIILRDSAFVNLNDSSGFHMLAIPNGNKIYYHQFKYSEWLQAVYHTEPGNRLVLADIYRQPYIFGIDTNIFHEKDTVLKRIFLDSIKRRIGNGPPTIFDRMHTNVYLNTH